MATTIKMIKTSISIQKTLLDQAEILAQHLDISRSRLFETAIENFIRRTLLDENNNDGYDNVYQGQPAPDEQSKSAGQEAQTAMQMGRERKVINQGDIYWVQLENPNALKPGIPHPYVVIQDNVFNHSRISTVVACALTSNIKRVSNTPGNILLEVGEANLPKQSVVEVSKVSTVNKAALGEYIGSLTEQRISQILAGMRFLQMSFFTRY
jgi:mRNA interferase MazF